MNRINSPALHDRQRQMGDADGVRPYRGASLSHGASLTSAASLATASAAATRDPLRVLHILPSLDPRMGGVAEAVVQLVRHMTPFGCTSEVATLDAPDGPAFDRVDAPVHRLGPGRGFYGLSLPLVRWLRANRARFDAFVVHGIWQFHSFAAWSGVIGSRTPLFVFPHGMLDPWFQYTYPKKHLKKRIYWALLEQWVFNRADRVLFTCETELELARRPFLGQRHRLAVNGFGIDSVPNDDEVPAHAFSDAFPEVRNKRVMLFLSRIHEKKGCDLLIDAFADVAALDRDLCLAIAGPGEPALLERLKSLAASRGIAERIVWTGMLGGALKWSALRTAEVFVLPSHQENFGIAVVEAMASRTPVIITNKVNIWREIEASGGGWVCDDTRESVADALRRWALDTTADARDAMRDTALACYERHFRIETAARHLVSSVSLVSSSRKR
ncbi:glycosyltransferase [Paraburkholderia rhizosphaerae]|uniref:Glycosyltransferase involved in cell wall biosynthesis n=1 Tax=Paraburkholderia rhizosphaerae TaxID=480658 RepID=A0A4R8LEF1_9BURK|nr:glycosyltransferase [Paraburkholderia rhizosphaerae]TDY40500.1 glycosyltransferase involved in cell wall biosynthesis [Paraburkholderia rhizosphaerae]